MSANVRMRESYCNLFVRVIAVSLLLRVFAACPRYVHMRAGVIVSDLSARVIAASLPLCLSALCLLICLHVSWSVVRFICLCVFNLSANVCGRSHVSVSAAHLPKWSQLVVRVMILLLA